MSSTAHFWLPKAGLSPAEWLERHQAARQSFSGPRDTRVPAFLPHLVKELCSLRSSLEVLRWVYAPRSEGLTQFCQGLSGNDSGAVARAQDLGMARLVENCLARVDWREQDILEMMLEYLQGTTVEGAGSDAPGPGVLRDELHALEGLRLWDRPGYDRAVQGLISEARASFMGINWAFQFLHNMPRRRLRLDEEAFRLLLTTLRLVLGLEPAEDEASPLNWNDPAGIWAGMHGEAQERWLQQGITVPLKPFEKASLFLLEALPLDNPGHAGFVRYLCEHDDAYRRLLACCYAPLAVQVGRLLEEVERYNRLPEHAARRAHYQDDEPRLFMAALLQRPDAVAAIVDRERHKDIYLVVSGLGPSAYLPRTLHEVQNIFGYITPEAFQQVVNILELDPVDVIRVIASYKQYSADPGGDIIIYLCKGTACFLRGQPDLSRRLAAEIHADEGTVGQHGIQFIEMDCFGVCHLAPVVKARDTFLGKRTVEDIPRLLEQLLKGPAYENRNMFLERIRRMLAPGHRSDRLEEMRIVEVVEDAAGPRPSLEVQGDSLEIDATGQVFAGRNGRRQPLGQLRPGALVFSYPTPDGDSRWGGVIVDDARQIQATVCYPAPHLRKELTRTVKPQAYVDQGAVWVERTDGPVCLGTYNANVIAVESADGMVRLVRLSGPPNQALPEKEQGIAAGLAGGAGGDRADFVGMQDRLVLEFAPETDPDEINSYLAQGGYEAVYKVLGKHGDPPWEPRSIVIEISEARLRGRGGAGFPTGRKWDGMRLAKCVVEAGDDNQDAIKLIVANGDEGDPGAFMDRTLIQERPHQVIEGMILAAIATGARYGVIYVRKEYEDAVRRLEHALFQARRKGFLGENIFGEPGLHFDLDIRLGAGAFVAGEKRAIMRAIEGKPAEPTLNAVSNTLRGLWGKPTLLNNVETFANVPLIIQKGGAWYAQQGTDRSGGSKIFSVAGIVNQTGLVEVRFGRTLNDIIAICGGIQQGKVLAGVQIGGPSGAILSLTGVRSYLLHIPLDFDAFDQVGAMLGSGGLVFIGEDDDVVRLARHFTDWLAEESCGQCPPCLQGTVSLGRTLDVILQGEGLSEHIHALWAKSDAIKAGSACGLGMTAANPVTSALRFFPHTFLHYLLANPRVNQLELFAGLEALRLLTRENVEKIVARRRQAIGYTFTLRRHLLRYLVLELERLDQYRPPHERQAQRLLALLQMPTHEVGVRDVHLECSPEQLEQHRLSLQDMIYDPALMATA
jgi:NADH:ubiquinone oxidoreductase subunit F (NADH-binding)/NADH:ubiquinone oxidoreductase subunit E